MKSSSELVKHVSINGSEREGAWKREKEQRKRGTGRRLLTL